MILSLLNAADPARAQLSPGKLARAHESLEGLRKCTNCHEIGEGTSREKCLTCHTAIGERVEAGLGLHARPEFRECSECHTEHHGRDFDLIYWEHGPESLDHTKTGFALTGKHVEVDCRKCHEPRNIATARELQELGKDLSRTYLGLRQECRACHDDSHRDQLSSECTNCHTTEGWRPATQFDHANARFPLTGRHQEVSCERCHPTVSDGAEVRFVQYLVEFDSCERCHKDPHRERLGADCTSCHQTSGWDRVSQSGFDHDKTRYPLRGRHTPLACETCHRSRAIETLVFDACTPCHVDEHAGQLGAAPVCETCHTVQGFQPAQYTEADHARTEFPLDGGHRAVPCIDCHTRDSQGRVLLALDDVSCRACHEDPHLASEMTNAGALSWASGQVQQTGCQACHNKESWALVSFDHRTTDFALEGAHDETSCRSCHSNVIEEGAAGRAYLAELARTSLVAQAPVRFTAAATECAFCHPDVHAGQFADLPDELPEGAPAVRCQRCHDPADWKARGFDHQRDASYTLDGAHINVECAKCHTARDVGGAAVVTYKPLASECIDCHGTQTAPSTGGTR